MTIRHDSAETNTPPLSRFAQGLASGGSTGLRVALVHDWLTGLRGGEKCLERLCYLFPDAHIHTLIHHPGSVGDLIGSKTIHSSPLQRLPGVSRYYRSLLPVMPWAVSQLEVGDVDVVISLSHCVAKAIRVPEGVPHLCYCFTPMRYAWDGRDAYLDRWPKRSVKRRLAEALLNRLARWDADQSKNVDQFVAISRTIQNRIQTNYHRDSVIISPPVDTRFYSPDSSIEREDFYLAASALVPYKKLDQAVEACCRLGRRLVLVGSGPELERIRDLAGPTVEVLGYQPDDVLRFYMQRCRALLFPGDEDFGIVPIEALACGTPVIALNRGGVAETVDQSVGRLYDDQTVESLMEAILLWENQPKPANLAGRARAKAERFAVEQFDSAIMRQVNQLWQSKAISASSRSESHPELLSSAHS